MLERVCWIIEWETSAMEQERERERDGEKEKESGPRRGGDFHKSVQIMWERFVAYHRLLFQYVQKKLTIVCCVGFFSYSSLLRQQQQQKETGWNWDMMMINVTAYMKLLFIKIICERGEHRARNMERRNHLWWKSMPRLCSLFNLRTPKISM